MLSITALILTSFLTGCGGNTPLPRASAAPAPAAAVVSPTALSFSDTSPGTASGAQSVTLTNPGPESLSASFTLSGPDAADFAQTNTCTQVEAAATCSVSVNFVPSGAGTFTATLAGTARDGAVVPPVALTGTEPAGPQAAVAPAAVDFGAVSPGTSASPQVVTLTNNGTAALALTGITITGAGAGAFAENNTCGPSLDQGAQCAITVTFTPAGTGEQQAHLVVADNAAGGGSQTATLEGTGASATVAIVPAFGPVAGGTVLAIEGLKLTPAAGGAPPAVTIGGAAAANVLESSDGTMLQVTAPAGTAGAAAVAINGASIGAEYSYTAAAAGCGSDCGDVGDPYAGQGAPAQFQPISSCQTIQANGYYLVTRDLSGNISASDPNCLHVDFPPPTSSSQAPFTLDLGGHTVNGTIAIEANGGYFVLMNGSVLCNTSGGVCIAWQVGSGHIHHITVENASLTPLGNIDAGARVAATTVAPTLQIDHVTSTVVASAPGAHRTRNIMIDGANGSDPTVASAPVEVFDNFITCSARASSCQGIEMYNSSHSYIHNNKIVQSADCTGCTDTSRGILFDTGSNDDVAAYNDFEVNGTNRGVRVRSSYHIAIYGNVFNNVYGTNPLDSGWSGYGTIEAGPYGGVDDPEFVEVFENTFQLGTAGSAVLAAGAGKVFIFDNTATCDTAEGCNGVVFAKTNVANYPTTGENASITVSNNDLTQLKSPQIHACGPTAALPYDCDDNATASTTAHVCNNGAVTLTGKGAFTTTPDGTPCAAPPAPPQPQAATLHQHRL